MITTAATAISTKLRLRLMITTAATAISTRSTIHLFRDEPFRNVNSLWTSFDDYGLLSCALWGSFVNLAMGTALRTNLLNSLATFSHNETNLVRGNTEILLNIRTGSSSSWPPCSSTTTATTSTEATWTTTSTTT